MSFSVNDPFLYVLSAIIVVFVVAQSVFFLVKANRRAQQMDTVGLGSAAQAMGAGRKVNTDVIDPAVGFVMRRRIGDQVKAGEALATVHARDEASAQAASDAIIRCVSVGPEPAAPCKLIHAIVTNDGVERL